MNLHRTWASVIPSLPGLAKSIILAGLCCIFSASALTQSPTSHESDRATQVRKLNNRVLQLHGQLQENPSATAGVRSQASLVLGQRTAALQALIQEDPRTALSFAFSSELLADLALTFPDSTAQLESHLTLNGSIEHWTADYPNQKFAESWHMNAGGERYDLHFAIPMSKNIDDGSAVTITGVKLGRNIAVSEARRNSQAGSVYLSGRYSFDVFSAAFTNWNCAVLLLLLCVLAYVPFALRSIIRNASRSIRAPLKCLVVGMLTIVVTIVSPLNSLAQTSTCSTVGVQNVAVLLVTFPGVAPPSNITQQSVNDMFFSATGPSLDGFWREASYGQTSASGNVFGWYTLDATFADCTRLDLLRDAAISAAANAGVPIQNFNRIFVVTTDFGCGWTGLALGTCTSLNSPNGSFVATASFLDASWQRSQTEGAQNAAHEGGHNMGLSHAQLRTFGSEPLGSVGTAGTITEYGDPFSDMSCSNNGHYAIPHKAEVLNWISSGTNYQVVQGNGSWTLQPLEINPAGLVALKIQRGTGSNGWLWIEYRQPVSLYDSIWDPAGALIHYEDAMTGTHTQLLDFTPATGSAYDSALMPGATWVDPYSNLSISVQSATASGLTVTTNYGATPCTPASPGVTVSPLDPSINPGQSADYSATVTNNDSPGCSSSTISLASSEPSGWPTSFSASSVTLSPGQSTSVSLGKAAPLGTPAGTYAVNLSASTSAATSSATANATVVTPPSLAVNVSVSGTAFSRPGTVPLKASVINAGVPVSGAGVTFTVITASGSQATQTATTGTDGSVTWNYKLNAKTSPGAYSASAQARISSGSRKTASTQAATSNTVQFAVQ